MGSNRHVSLCTHANLIIICLIKSASHLGYPQASDSKIPKERFPGFTGSQISLDWLHIAFTTTMMRRKMKDNLFTWNSCFLKANLLAGCLHPLKCAWFANAFNCLRQGQLLLISPSSGDYVFAQLLQLSTVIKQTSFRSSPWKRNEQKQSATNQNPHQKKTTRICTN